MINDDAYPSLPFPGLNCDLEDTGVMCSGCTVSLIDQTWAE